MHLWKKTFNPASNQVYVVTEWIIFSSANLYEKPLPFFWGGGNILKNTTFGKSKHNTCVAVSNCQRCYTYLHMKNPEDWYPLKKMSESEGGLVNKSIFTVKQHYHKQETTILNDKDSMILNLLSLHNHVGNGKFFTPPWSPVTPPPQGLRGG